MRMLVDGDGKSCGRSGRPNGQNRHDIAPAFLYMIPVVHGSFRGRGCAAPREEHPESLVHERGKRMRSLVRRWALVVLLLAVAVVPVYADSGKQTLSQVSTFDALMRGCFDGIIPVAAVSRYGDFGIGTFHGLDGEMVILDGKVFKVPVDGKPVPARPDWTIPFLSVTFFKADKHHNVQAGADLKAVSRDIESGLPSKNFFYAIRIDGKFQKVQTRSVAKQLPPYPALLEAVKKQVVFDLADVEGTAVGFWCPTYVKGINIPGFHLHFLTKDLKAGGHLLDFIAEKAVVKIHKMNEFFMILPDTPVFGKMDFTIDEGTDMKDIVKPGS